MSPTTDAHAASGVIKLFKRHRDVMFDGDEDRPISIIISTLAATAYQGQRAIASTLAWVLPRMGELIENRGGQPWVANPSYPLENFADKWAEKPRKHQLFAAWLQQANKDCGEYLRASRFNDIPAGLATRMTERSSGDQAAARPVGARGRDRARNSGGGRGAEGDWGRKGDETLDAVVPGRLERLYREAAAALGFSQPRLDVRLDAAAVVIEGRFILAPETPALAEQGPLATYEIRVEIPPGYPVAEPLVFETGGAFPHDTDHHVYDNDRCCVLVWENWTATAADVSIRAFFEGPFRNYFLGQYAGRPRRRVAVSASARTARKAWHRPMPSASAARPNCTS